MPETSPPSTVAAVDLGSNSFHMVVARVVGRDFQVLDRVKQSVRLAAGLDARGKLTPAAQTRALDCLRAFGERVAELPPSAVRAVGTNALRKAHNTLPFLVRASAALGHPIEVISGREEARLIYLGVCRELHTPGRRLVIDIGGGSTELMWLDRHEWLEGREPGHALSMPLGVVTLSESFGGASDAEAYARMVETAFERLSRAGRMPERSRGLDGRRLQMLGTSGTVTTLAAVHLGLRRYDRRKVDGISLPFAAIQAVSSQLRALDDRSRAAHPCIGAGRADLVVAGCAILDAVHRLWPVERLQVADRGLREGILNALMGQSLRQALLLPEDVCA